MLKEVARTATTLLIAFAIAAWVYQAWVAKPEQQRQRATVQHAEASQRFAEWARVVKEKEVAPGETIKLVVIPSPLGHELFDTKCLIYTHREFKTSSMICPDAKQSDLEAGE
jgi:hypothetical protein